MSRFISIILAIVLVTIVSAPVAIADNNTYDVNAVVISCYTMAWGGTEIEAIDTNGTIWEYPITYKEQQHVGDIVVITLTHSGHEEADEVVSVKTIGHIGIERTYPLAGRIIETNWEKDLVTFIDGAGNTWCFYGIEDFIVDDVVACILWDMGTTDYIFDDIILDVDYAGVF